MAEQLTLSELKAILNEQGIDMIGNKANFVARLAKLDTDGSIVRDWLSWHNDETARQQRIEEAQKEKHEDLEEKMSKLNFRSRRIARYKAPMAKSIIAKMRLMDQKEKNKIESFMLRDVLNFNLWEKKKKINMSSWSRLRMKSS